jgi:hypothetical protein
VQDDPGTLARGKLFTLALLLLTLSQPIGFVLFCYWWLDFITPDYRTVAVIEVALLAVTGLVALLGIWQWRRWGVYLLVLIAVLSFVYDLLSGVPLSEMAVRIGVFEVTYDTSYPFIPGLPVVLATMITFIVGLYKRWPWFR